MDPFLPDLEKAKAGDHAALNRIVKAVADDVYGLSLRMLWHPEDAQDATQEILVKVIVHLGSFRGESAFRTWVYRIGCRHLSRTRLRRMERRELSFDAFGEDLLTGLSERPYEGADRDLLEEEVKIGCTQAMLLCLDRGHRLAYILGEIFGLAGQEGAEILEITPMAFRQRLARARQRIRSFMGTYCGLVNLRNPCRCVRRIDPARRLGRLDPTQPLFAGRPVSRPGPGSFRREREELEELHASARIFRNHPDYAAPGALLQAVRKMVESGRYGIIDK